VAHCTNRQQERRKRAFNLERELDRRHQRAASSVSQAGRQQANRLGPGKEKHHGKRQEETLLSYLLKDIHMQHGHGAWDETNAVEGGGGGGRAGRGGTSHPPTDGLLALGAQGRIGRLRWDILPTLWGDMMEESEQGVCKTCWEASSLAVGTGSSFCMKEEKKDSGSRNVKAPPGGGRRDNRIAWRANRGQNSKATWCARKLVATGKGQA